MLLELAPDEHYAGIILNEDGTPSHHLILLPYDAEKISWDDAMSAALNADVALPTRQEQALLYANCKAHFASTWYWSSEQHTFSSNVWCQHFGHGLQSGLVKSDKLRARAIRRHYI